MKKIIQPSDLVTWVTKKKLDIPDTGLVLKVNDRHKIANVMWPDYIGTHDWEDIEVINENSFT